MTQHLALLPACACGCTVTLVVYELDADGTLIERELDRGLSRPQGERLLAFVAANVDRIDTRYFPVTDAWAALTSTAP